MGFKTLLVRQPLRLLGAVLPFLAGAAHAQTYTIPPPPNQSFSTAQELGVFEVSGPSSPTEGGESGLAADGTTLFYTFGVASAGYDELFTPFGSSSFDSGTLTIYTASQQPITPYISAPSIYDLQPGDYYLSMAVGGGFDPTQPPGVAGNGVYHIVLAPTTFFTIYSLPPAVLVPAGLPSAVPEPTTLVLLSFCLPGLVFMARCRSRKRPMVA